MKLGVLLIVLLVLFASCGKDSKNPAGLSESGHSLSGKLLHANGFAIADAAVSLSGGMEREIRSDSSGVFTFSGLPDGAYTLSFSKQGLVFESNKTVAVDGKDIDAGVFWGGYASKTKFTFVGRVLDETGNPVKGVTLHITGDEFEKELLLRDLEQVTCTLQFGKTYTVIPEKTGYSYSFSPEKWELTAPDSVSVCTFSARYTGSPLHSISGRIVDKKGNPIRGLLVLKGDAAPQFFYADSTGTFAFSGLRDNDYIVNLDGAYTWNPQDRVITVAGRDVSLGDLECSYRGTTLYTLSGRVVDQNGAGIPDLFVNITPGAPWGNPYTGADGTYQQKVGAGGGIAPEQVTMIIRPEKDGWVFIPDSTTVTLSWAAEVMDGGTITIPDFVGRNYSIFTAADYFPMLSTSSWTYDRTANGQPAERRVSVSGGLMMEGQAYQQFAPEGPTGCTVFRIEGNIVYTIRADRKVELFRFAAIPGTAWKSGSQSGQYPVTGTFLGLESVTVPAGSYSDCPKFEMKTVIGETSYETCALWFARGVGVVRSERVLVNYGEVKERIIDTLKSFAL
jgi:protocatechuate 3,4-dioxygenase beta subunit